MPRSVAGDDWGELLSSEPFVRYDRATFGGRQVDRFLRSAQLTVRQVCEVIGLVHRAPRTLSEPARLLAQMLGDAYRSL